MEGAALMPVHSEIQNFGEVVAVVRTLRFLPVQAEVVVRGDGRCTIASSTCRPPKAMQDGPPWSIQARLQL